MSDHTLLLGGAERKHTRVRSRSSGFAVARDGHACQRNSVVSVEHDDCSS